MTQASWRYLVTAGSATLLYLGVLKGFLLTGVHYMVAIAVSQLVVIPVAFVAYRRFVFGPGTSTRTDFSRFLTIWVTGALLGALAAPFMVELLHWDPWAAQLFGTAVVACGSFVGHRLFTFRKSTD